MHDIEDIETLKNEIRRILQSSGIDISHIENDQQAAEKALALREATTKRIYDFMLTKVESNEKEVEISSDITYFRDHQTVGLPLILQWLGTLLDNTLEATDDNPIHILVMVTADLLNIRFENAYTGDDAQQISIIVEEGYSTKGEGRGIGLYNLNQQVIEAGGKLYLEVYHDTRYECPYIRAEIILGDAKTHQSVKQPTP